MLRRPWPIVLLALFQILTPFANIAMNTWLYHVPFATFFASFRHAPFFEIYQTFLLMPVAGIALFAMKKWSYPVFLISWILGVIGNAQAWHALVATSSTQPIAPIWLICLMILMNLTLLIYFLIPTVRAAYYRPNIRWWETQPRYMMAIQGDAIVDGKTIAAEIENLSQDGMKISPHNAIQDEVAAFSPGQLLDLSFRVIEHSYQVRGKVVHTDSRKSSGVELVHTPESREAFKGLMRELRALKIERRPKAFSFEDSWDDFKVWLSSLKKSPAALLPELPKKR